MSRDHDAPDEVLDAFDDDQVARLLECVRTEAVGGALDSHRAALLRWAHRTYVSGLLLDLALGGHIAVIGFEHGEPRWVSTEFAEGQSAIAAAGRVIGGAA